MKYFLRSIQCKFKVKLSISTELSINTKKEIQALTVVQMMKHAGTAVKYTTQEINVLQKIRHVRNATKRDMPQECADPKDLKEKTKTEMRAHLVIFPQLKHTNG